MNQTGQDEPGIHGSATRGLGRWPRFWLGVLLPPERRDEFIGDLLEEAAELERKTSRAIAQQWLWAQVWRSLPSLVKARLRRDPVARAVAVPAGSGAFAGVLWGGRGRGARSLAVSLSVIVHVVMLTALLVRGMWSVDELAPPRVVVTFWQNMLPQLPLFDAPAAAQRRANQERSERTVAKTPRAQPTPVSASKTALATHVDEIGTDKPSGDGPPQSESTSDCAAGTCGDAPARVLPPTVGEKSCLSCALPRLPPAYARIGTVNEMLVKICVTSEGKVKDATVLRGISPAADEGVIATLMGWRFFPYAVDGRPVPFCYVSRFMFSAQ